MELALLLVYLCFLLQLDDDEFQLPPVGELPTLESILNENDPGSVSDDDLAIPPPPHPKVSKVLHYFIKATVYCFL